MRSMWEKYYTEANAVIFVVDSADVSRLDEAKTTFGMRRRQEGGEGFDRNSLISCSEKLLDDESLIKSGTPVITFANKQDLSVRERFFLLFIPHTI